MHLRTAFGRVALAVWRGKNPADQSWAIPIRQHWGLSAHQQLSPALEDKLAYFATVTGSYAAAARLAAKVGCPVDESTVQALVQRLGARALRQTQTRLARPPAEKEPARAPSPLAVLMIDGFQVRHRGPGWGKKKTKKPRVEWHETKVGVYYRHEQAGRSPAGRGQITDKVVVSWQGPPLELGRRLHWQALRGGLGRAQAVLVAGDGAPWIWRLAADRWAGAHQLLDFYHASQHVWELGRALHGEGDEAARPWVERQLHRLRHGQERAMLRDIATLRRPKGTAGAVVEREQHYFAGHAGRMNYQENEERGWPLGSGVVESACLQKQGRRKRAGQFWTSAGLAHLDALEEARDHGYWDQLWLSA